MNITTSIFAYTRTLTMMVSLLVLSSVALFSSEAVQAAVPIELECENVDGIESIEDFQNQCTLSPENRFGVQRSRCSILFWPLTTVFRVRGRLYA